MKVSRSTFWTLWIMKNMPSLCNIGIRIHSNSTQCKVHSGDEDLSINGGGLTSFFACMAEIRRHKCLCPCRFQCLTWQLVLQYQAALQPRRLSKVCHLWLPCGTMCTLAPHCNPASAIQNSKVPIL